ncbi:MAG: hypothetical protein IPK60_03500 [Sandaracinaceae bacterium]|nr:hypothetical protein [Sandaracinaceae bacterium]
MAKANHTRRLTPIVVLVSTLYALAHASPARAQQMAPPDPAVPAGYEQLAIPPAPTAPQLASATFAVRGAAESRTTHVAPELLGALAGGAVGTGVAVGAIFLAVARCFDSSCDPSVGVVLGGLVAFTTYLLALPAGVYWAGNAAGGRGQFGYTVLGHIAGMAVGGTIAAGLVAIGDENNDDGYAYAAAVVWYAASAAGAILGYELSAQTSTSSRPPAPVFQLAPTLAPTASRDGAVIGVAGAF